ncbi:MFS transporter [Rhodoferax sp.]|uniref:MFS transporter n=1 Tax=Rhodoferax sp. TaxID=50421 RepID=UPI00374D10F7
MPMATPKLSMTQMLLCGAAIVTMSMGIRHGFGLWLQPITQSQNWSRETFAFAIAIQNLVWGFTGIFAGMLADRFGAFKVIVAGAVLYALGLVGMATANTPLGFILTAGVLIGMAQAGTTYAVIYGVIGRNIAPHKRSWAMGVAAAAGSFGQFLMVPTEGFLIGSLGWQEALLVLGAASLMMAPLAWGLHEPALTGSFATRREQSILQALKEAFKYPSFQLLMAGYFVCGFQVVFIGVHMPSYLRDKGLSPQVAGYALALIGLFNVFGTYAAGVLGQRMQKKNILAFIYLARAIAISVFLLLPLTPLNVYVFSSIMGLLWLSTVPPTNATVAQIFGVTHLSMLSGFVFFSHQIGSFMGVWLGGYLYDRTGSYDLVWYIAIGLGVLAAVFNLPIKEASIVRSPALQRA